MPTNRIYCDYNATAPLRPEARAALERALEMGNPSSVHAEGRRARAVVEGAREQIAAAIGACRDDIAFCSGGTEACQTPIRAAIRESWNPGAALLVSAIEHDCVRSLPLAERLPVSADGVIDLGALRDQVALAAAHKRRPVVSLMLVNNETGVIQPVAEAAEIVHAAGGLIHCDAVQGLGRITVSVIDLDVDYLSVSAHKIGGPQGVGAFYVRPGAPFIARQTGGGQEFGRRSGTENVAGIAGFGAAVQAIDLVRYEALRPHREAMEATLQAAASSLQVHGQAAKRVAGVSCFGVEGWPAETQIMNLDLDGFALSAGAACSSGKVRPSHVLQAMGVSEAMARSSVRASFGWASAPDEFEQLAAAWIRAATRARPGMVKRESANA